MSPNFELRGVQDLLQIYEDRLAITPKGVLGFLSKGLKGTKEIPFRSIVAVQFRAAGLIVNGYIQFTIAGGNESRGGVLSATQDENTFMFVKAVNAQAHAIKDFVDGKIAAIHAPQSARQDKKSLAEQISELAALRQQGILSEEEFAMAKTRLIS